MSLLKTSHGAPDDCDWKVCPTYAGYQASDTGRIRRINGQEVITRCNDGRYIVAQVGIRRSPGARHRRIKYVTRCVHRMVCDAFLGPCPKGFVVNHKDGNKRNNLLANLEYVTPSQNARHALANELVTSPHRKLTPSRVQAMRERHAKGETVCALAAEFNLNAGYAAKVIARQTWKDVGISGKPRVGEAKL